MVRVMVGCREAAAATVAAGTGDGGGIDGAIHCTPQTLLFLQRHKVLLSSLVLPQRLCSRNTLLFLGARAHTHTTPSSLV